MRLLKITLSGFMSYKNRQTFDFDNDNIVLVTAPNGTGKSTVFTDALSYALFGKTVKSINKSDIQSWDSSASTEVTVDLIDEEKGDIYSIFRGERPYVLQIFKNNVLLSEESKRSDTQKIIDALLGVQYKTFTQVNVIASIAYKQLLSMKDKELLDTIKVLLQQDMFDIAYELCKRDAVSMAKSILSMQHERDVVFAKMQTMAEMNIANKELFQDELSTLTAEYKALCHKRAALVEQSRSLKDTLEANSELYESYKRIISETKRLQALDLKQGEKCDTCGSVIDDEHISAITEAISNNHATLNSNLSFISNHRDAIKQSQVLQKEISDIEIKIATVVKNGTSLKARLSSDKTDELAQLLQSVEDIDKKIAETEYKHKLQTAAQKALSRNGLLQLILHNFISNLIDSANGKLIEFGSEFRILMQDGALAMSTILGKSVTYFALSQGEKMRLDLAILLSIKELLSARLGFIVFDESLSGSLDNEGRAAAIEILNRQKYKIVIISHDSDISQALETVKFEHWTVEKDATGSKLVRLE